jgi:hypothetical protein
MSTTAPEQPVEGQDQQVTPPAATPAAQVPAPVAPLLETPAPGPWASDLAQLFPDDATRGTVDQFLRSKVQPYTTQLEQKASVSENASRLWNDLENQPIDTYVAITTELFGEEASQELLANLQARLQQTPQDQTPPAPGQPAPQADPRQEALYTWVEQKQAQEAYDEGIARIQGDANTQDVDTDLIHPFVAAAGGDFNQAVTMYRQFYQQFQSKNAPAEEVAPPPPVTGSDTSTAAAPSHTEPRSQSIGDAINDFMDEQRASREAPPVGTA